MTTQQRQLESLIVVSIAKVFSDHSTMLINELGATKQKHHFKQAVKYVDSFIKSIENRLKPDEVDFLQNITDAQTNALNDMRNELNKNKL
jgi:hypothetical protein